MRIRSFTPATRSLFRFQDQDRGRLFSDVVSRVDQRQLELWGLKVLETGNSIEEELSLEDGKECYVLRVLPYRDANGAIDGVILVFSDVTKIRQTQADLARNEGLARQRTHEIETLYKTAPVGMAVVDRNHRYLKINQRFADLTGNSMDSHIGRTHRRCDAGPERPFTRADRRDLRAWTRSHQCRSLRPHERRWPAGLS